MPHRTLREDDPPAPRRLREPGATPRLDEVPALLGRIEAGGNAGLDAVRALGRMVPAPVAAVLAAEAAAPGDARAAFARLLGMLARREPAARDRLLARLSDPSPLVRRRAASALGRLGQPAVGAALAARLAAESDAPARRALVEALGKSGAAVAAGALAALSPEGDPVMLRVLEQARMRAHRDAARALVTDRGPEARFLADRVPPPGLVPALRCRAGLERLLQDELGEGARVLGTGAVAAPPGWTLSSLARVRLALHVELRVPDLVPRGATPADLADAAASEAVLRALFAVTHGELRYRVAWPSGHRRDATRALAARLMERAPRLLNDPRRSDWTLAVEEAERGFRLAWRPALPDGRFEYRLAEIPAASHPTVAAALARVSGVVPGDVVWDPFVGSGLELVERWRLGPWARAFGTDVDPGALAAARRNLDAAGTPGVELHQVDARSFEPPARVTLIVTHPPHGRRVARGAALHLQKTLLRRAAALLPERGRLVWITTMPGELRAAGSAAGLRLRAHCPVDLGGFHGELQRWERQRSTRQPVQIR